MGRFGERWLLWAVLVAGQGCGQPVAVPRTDDAPSGPELIDESAMTHHFGTFVNNPNRKLKHAYRLVNSTNHEVKVVDLINGKPCCGEVNIGQTTLRVGDETAVEVTLSVRQEFGDIVHKTTVVTEPCQVHELVLTTTAKVYPLVRVEEVAPSEPLLLLTSEKPKSLECRVVTYGSPSEPPVDLDFVELGSSVKVSWKGTKERWRSDDGSAFESRTMVALLEPTGTPGQRRERVLLRYGQRLLYTHALTWELAAPIRASPRTVVMKPHGGRFRVVIHSRDLNRFRVRRVECGVAGIRGTAEGSEALLTHEVRLECDGSARMESAREVVTVFTDHPAQPRVELPVILLK